MFLSYYRDTKGIFYLFYKITKVFLSFRYVTHVSVLQYKMKMTSPCLSILACYFVICDNKYAELFLLVIIKPLLNNHSANRHAS